MRKFSLIGLALAGAIYFIFFASGYPGEIEFQGITFDSKKNINNTLDKEYDIISYRDKSNHHVLIFGIRNNSERTLEDFSKVYLSLFEKQGFAFKSQKPRHLGTKGDEYIFITKAENIGGIIIYMMKDATLKFNPSTSESIFTKLERFAF